MRSGTLTRTGGLFVCYETAKDFVACAAIADAVAYVSATILVRNDESCAYDADEERSRCDQSCAYDAAIWSRSDEVSSDFPAVVWPHSNHVGAYAVTAISARRICPTRSP